MTSNITLFASIEEIINNLEKTKLADLYCFNNYKPFQKAAPPHQHPQIEINYVKKGGCILHIKNESVSFKENEMMIICSNVNHSFEFGAKETTLIQLKFLQDIFSHFDSSDNSTSEKLMPLDIFSEANHVIKIVNNVRIMRAVHRIVEELNGESKYYQHLVIMYYAELLILIYRHLVEDYLTIGNNENLKKAITYLRNNYLNEISIDDVAIHTGIGERYLRKLFANHLNISPHDYLNQIRINKSIELLKNTEFSVKEVSFMCGYKSPQYFCRQFKKQIGISPKKASNR